LSGAKSDAGDAAVIAEYLRLRAHRLQPATPYTAQTKALRTVVRAREDVVDMRVAAAQPSSPPCWTRTGPGAKAIFADVESAIALAFLTRYATYPSARAFGRETFAGLLCQARLLWSPERRGTADPVAGRPGRQHRRGVDRRGPRRGAGPGGRAHRADRGREEPGPVSGPWSPASGSPPGRRDLHVAAKVGSDQRRPGARRVGRFPPSPRLAGRRRGAGRGHPVTKASGKYRAVHFQWACNKHLRKASTCFADNSRHASPWAAGVYARAIARGHDHPHAVRVLARAWIRVIYRCWIDGVPDDPNKHGSAGKLRDTATAA